MREIKFRAWLKKEKKISESLKKYHANKNN